MVGFEVMAGRNKRIRLSIIPDPETVSDPFEALPDDLVISILSKLCSSASSPSDFINALLVSKRFNRLGLNRFALSKASSELFSIRAKNWSDSAERFIRKCVLAGSIEACYFLGMIRFYCLENRGGGSSMMARAAIKNHAPALYSLAVIQFNGSGGMKTDKDLRAGVALCARAAYFGHVDARRELGHCLQDGYGVRRNIANGRRLLVQANAFELAAVLPLASRRLKSYPRRRPNLKKPGTSRVSGTDPVLGLPITGCVCSCTGLECALLSDFGCNVPLPEPHPVNRFLIEWFELKARESSVADSDSDMGMCSHSGCGRPETRPHEFRRCSACGAVRYCSRGCQAHDWKARHKAQCSPADQLVVGPVEAMGAHAVDDMVVDS